LKSAFNLVQVTHWSLRHDDLCFVGMRGIFMPYDHKAEIASGPADHYTLSLLQTLNRQICKNECTVGGGGASVGYLAHGTATDYMFEVLHVPVAMTWEIYGDDKADYDDCFRMFNPLTRAKYSDVIHRWSNAVLRTILLMEEHPSVQYLGLGKAGGGVDPAAMLGSAAGQLEHLGRNFIRTPTAYSGTVPLLRNGVRVWGHGHLEQSAAWQGGSRSGELNGTQDVYNPVRILLHGGGLFGGTLLMWCIARQFMQNRRMRRRYSESGGVLGDDAGSRKL
jgi:hypothetical protein